jgi:hypothetical protein
MNSPTPKPMSALQAALAAIAERHDVDVEDLSTHIQENFSGSLMSLKQLEPLVSEILRRFKRLPRKRNVDGTHPNIAGYRNFKSWCEGILHRSDRTVRYMLNGGNKKRKDSKVQAESVSALDAAKILKYLDTHVSDLDLPQRKLLAQGLPQFLNRLKRSVWTWKTTRR